MAFRYTREMIVEGWRDWFRTRKDDAEYQRKILDEFTRLGESGKWRPGDQDTAAEMLDVSMETLRRHVRMAESECPIGFFKPSWEQAQILNAWHPDFEPEIAPGGYQSICIFSANRIGKSAAVFISNLAWMLPNDPDWVMFEEHEDPPLYVRDGDPESGIRRPSRGKYTVLRRPSWETWRRTGRLTLPHHTEPPMATCEAWHGCPNDNDYNERICGRWGGRDGYLAWMPKSAIGRRSDGGESILRQDRKIILKTGHQITGKTYNSEEAAWQGKAVRIMALDEGLDAGKLIEARTRVEAGGYLLWAYTPTEARNIGGKSKVASDAYRGKLPLVGRSKFFTNFTMDDAPEHVLPAEKKRTDMEAFSMLGAAGKTRMCGGFFDSSPTVFSNFERERNVLPIDGSDVLLAMRGEVPERWRAEFGNVRADRLQFAFYEANILRGYDDGLANPSACTWQALLRTGEHVTFREWELSGLAVGERCEEVIARSGNERELLNPGVVSERRRYKERQPRGQDGRPTGGMAIRRTFADSKMFVRDEMSPADSFTENFVKAGLKIERAGNIKPGPRCDYLNDMLRADPTRQHLLDASKPGTRMYVTRDCMKVIERAENYLWAQLASGQRAGEFTDKPETKDDHIVDAWCYPAISKLRWRDPTPQPQEAVRVDAATGYVSR
jgi:hypothetical protein